MKKKINYVLWDFGGVLTNSPIKNFLEYEKKNNLLPGTIIRINSHNKFENAWAKLERNEINKKEFEKLFLEEANELNYNFKIDVEKIFKCLDVRLNTKMVNLFFKVKKKLPCACLTNNISENSSSVANKAFEQFKDNFSYTFESSKLGIRKPEIEIYKYVIKKLKVNPENILFIDDLGINLKPAKIIGMKTYKMLNYNSTKQYLFNLLDL